MYIISLIGLIFTCFIQVAEAAWPESSEGRIHALDVFRKDLKTPGNILEGEERIAAYKKACDLKYYPACNYKSWTDEDGYSNLRKAGKFFSSRCKSDGLSCVVSGWAYGYANGKPSNKSLNPSKAFKDLISGCTKKKYGPACAHLGEMYMMGVGTNINYKKALSLFQEACKAKDQYGCYLEADLYYHGWGILQDYGIAMEKYSKACEDGFLQACTKIGQMHEYGQGTQIDFTKANEVYQQNCDAGYTQACVKQGKMVQSGRGVAPDAEKSKELLQKACEAKDKYGCYLGGDLFFDEWEESEDLVFANKQLTNGCKWGNVQSCFELGELYEQAMGVPQDLQKAYRYYDQACAKNNPNGCANLARMQVTGLGGENVEMTGFELFKFLCGNGDARGCSGAAEFFEKGRGMPQNLGLATMLYGQACDSGYAKACSRLGAILLKSSRKEETLRGVELIKKSCNFGEIYGCVSLAELYIKGFSQNGATIEKDQAKAKLIFTDACSQKVEVGCFQLAKIYDDEGREQEALKAYEKACEYLHGDSCGILGARHFAGKGVEQSAQNAVPFFEKACAQGHKISCIQMADFYFKGEEGIERDSTLALERYKQACGLNSSRSCLLAGKIIQEEATDKKEGFRESVSFFEKGCELGNREACSEAEPLLFHSKYEEIVKKAFDSETCEVWVNHKEEKRKKYVSANKEKFTVFREVDGAETSQIFVATHKETNFTEGGSTRTAQSYWNLVSKEKTVVLEHHENWFFKRVKIQDFPGRDSFSRDEQDDKSIYYARKDGTLRRYTESDCRFIDEISILTAENCSEVQALISAQLVSECSE